MLSTALAEMKSDAPGQAAQNSSSNVQAITAQQPNQWLGSTLIGMTVVDPQNNTIGEVDDLLVEKDGQIQALIVGVGGFLGIGEKDIALPMSAFKVVPADRNANRANAPANSAANVTSTADRLQLSMTKDQLTQHAEFKGMESRQTTGSGAGSAPPRNQAAPAARDSSTPPKASDTPSQSNR
ncbi:MAG: PRC-barrel domain-containing protein [Xanthobacteraceae bacterium]